MKSNPLYAIPNSFLMLILGKVSFPNDRIGEMTIRNDGKRFRVFREIQLKAKKGHKSTPNGIFQVWFSTKAESQKAIRQSRMTLFGFLGLPGFRSKLWLINDETKEFGGIYEWDSVKEAGNYDKSFAMNFSHWRSLPNKFRTVVFPQSDERARVHHPDLSYTGAHKTSK